MEEAKNKSILVAIILLMAPLAGLGIDLFVPSLPILAKQFAVHESTVKFSIVLYLLGFAIGQPIFGTLSDAWGRRGPLLVGLVLYIVSSILLAFSHSIHMLLWLRVVQGMVVAAPGVLSKAIATDSFSGTHLAKLRSLMMTVWALGPIVAPVIGGYLEWYLGWQWDFAFFAIYGAILLGLVYFFYEESSVHRTPLNIPSVGSVYREICTHKGFLGAVACVSIAFSLIVVFNVMGPFLIETVMGYSPVDYGHFALFMGLGFFVGSLINRFLLSHFTVEQILPVSIYYAIAVALLMLVASIVFGVQLITLILFTFFILIASGSSFPNGSTICLSLFPKNAGTASAVMGFVLGIGTTIISSIASFLKTDTLIPISVFYVVLMGLCWVSYRFFMRKSPPTSTPKNQE